MRILEKCRNNYSDNPLASRRTDGGKNMEQKPGLGSCHQYAVRAACTPPPPSVNPRFDVIQLSVIIKDNKTHMSRARGCVCV